MHQSGHRRPWPEADDVLTVCFIFLIDLIRAAQFFLFSSSMHDFSPILLSHEIQLPPRVSAISLKACRAGRARLRFPVQPWFTAVRTELLTFPTPAPCHMTRFRSGRRVNVGLAAWPAPADRLLMPPVPLGRLRASGDVEREKAAACERTFSDLSLTAPDDADVSA